MAISFGSAWGVVEAMGWRRTRAFPVYFLESIPAVLLALVLTANLLNAILTLMVVFVFVLLGPAVIMGKIASDRRVMGESASKGVWKYAYWLSEIPYLPELWASYPSYLPYDYMPFRRKFNRWVLNSRGFSILLKWAARYGM